MRYYLLEEYICYTKQWNSQQLNHLDQVLSGRLKSNQSEEDFMSHMEIVSQIKQQLLNGMEFEDVE